MEHAQFDEMDELIKDAEKRDLIEKFIDFLDTKGMTICQEKWHTATGIGTFRPVHSQDLALDINDFLDQQ